MSHAAGESIHSVAIAYDNVRQTFLEVDRFILQKIAMNHTEKNTNGEASVAEAL